MKLRYNDLTIHVYFNFFLLHADSRRAIFGTYEPGP